MIRNYYIISLRVILGPDYTLEFSSNEPIFSLSAILARAPLGTIRKDSREPPWTGEIMSLSLRIRTEGVHPVLTISKPY